jgi:hypothetical protein
MKKPMGKKPVPPTKGMRADSKRKTKLAVKMIKNNNEMKKMNPGTGVKPRKQTPSSLKTAATYKGK